MNDNTTKLLETLANQLGTTSKYLWAILINHAHVSAIISCTENVGIILYLIIVWKIVNRFNAKFDDWTDAPFAAVALIVFACIFALLFSIGFFFNIHDIIIGFFDPQYWAINRILDCLHSGK